MEETDNLISKKAYPLHKAGPHYNSGQVMFAATFSFKKFRLNIKFKALILNMYHVLCLYIQCYLP